MTVTTTIFKVLLAFVLFKSVFVTAETPKLFPKDFGYAVQFRAQFTDRDWTYEMEQPTREVCGPETKMLIMIASAPNNLEKREAIRRSWMHDESNPDGYPAFFIIGRTDNKTLETEIAEEQQMHGDIIRYSGIDEYNMLPLKTHALLAWHREFCPSAPYLMKTDDDTVVYLKRLDHFVQTEFDYVRKYFPSSLFCNRLDNTRPIRRHSNKYFVTVQEYNGTDYPTYCKGCSYLVSADGVRSLLENVKDVPFLRLEDVLFTGMIAQNAGVHHHGSSALGYKTPFVYADDVPYLSVVVGLPADRIPIAYRMLKEFGTGRRIRVPLLYDYHFLEFEL